MAVTARYLGWVALFGAAGMAAAWLLRAQLGPPRSDGWLLGAGVATLGAAGGMLLTAWAFDRNQRQFFSAMMLVILGRLVIYGATLVFVALRTAIDPVATAASLLTFYVIHQVLEVRMALKGLSRGSS